MEEARELLSKSRGLWGSISERVSGAENKDFSPCITPMPLPNRKASFLGPKLWRPLLQAPKSPPPCPWFPGDPNSGGGWREGGPRRPGRGGEPVGGSQDCGVLNLLEDRHPQEKVSREAGLKVPGPGWQAQRQQGLGLGCAAGPGDVSA